jgi:hypothetical protein
MNFLLINLISARASKRNVVRRNKTALGPGDRADTSLIIEDLSSNKTTGKLS